MTLEHEGAVKVLLVDDDEDDFILTRDLLAEVDADGFALDWASSYEDARLRIARAEHDLYLVDYHLGERTGLDLLREVEAGLLEAPVIVLTGQGDHGVDLDAMRAGAVDYLSKAGLSAALLERSIRYAIRQKHTESALRSAIRERDDVLGIVSHDLRNPLNAVRMGLEVLEDVISGTEPTRRGDAYLEIVGRAVHQMDRLIEDLLDVARIEAGKLSLNARPEPVEQLARTAIEGFRAAAEQKRIRLVLESEDGLPVLHLDGDRIVQALSNILGNAVRFTPESGSITVRIESREDGIRISVRDTGSGIESEHLNRIFDRFWQARSNRRAGAGLGLAIARGIVNAHGGHIWAESELGRGSTFHLNLPSRLPAPPPERT